MKRCHVPQPGLETVAAALRFAHRSLESGVGLAKIDEALTIVEAALKDPAPDELIPDRYAARLGSSRLVDR